MSILFATAFLGGCSDNEGGTAEPTGESAQGPSSASSAPSSSAESALANLDPCSILTTEEVSQHGTVKDPKREQVGTGDTCTWPADAGDTADLVPTMGVAIRENGGVDDLPDKGSGVQRTEEGGREYARAAAPSACTIAIGVTDTSRVDVVVSGTETADEACRVANALTEAAEPNVPRG